MPRQLRPRPDVVAAPTHVSQITCTALLGIDPRRYLDLLLAHPEVPRAAIGKLRVVALDDLRALLARLATSDDSAPAEVRDDAPATADAVLAAIGMRRSA